MESQPSFPRTSVSFAPTTSFNKAFPNEIDEQSRKFVQPTWQGRIEMKPELEEDKRTAKPIINDWVKQVPVQALQQPRSAIDTPPLFEEVVQNIEPKVILVGAIAVGIFLIGGIYFFKKWWNVAPVVDVEV